MRRFILTLAFVLALGCGDTPGGDDAGARDAGRLPDAGSIDAGSADAGDDAAAVDAAAVDAEVVDSGGTDAGGDIDAGRVDAGSVTDFGPVACRSTADCGTDQTCDVDAPGGRCTDCFGIDACGSEFECFGTCLRLCSDDTECNAGMRCASFAGSSYCRPRDCADCPSPYVCRDTECSRPLCGAGGACPSPLTCLGTVCVEP